MRRRSETHALVASYDEDTRPHYTQPPPTIGGLLDCVVACQPVRVVVLHKLPICCKTACWRRLCHVIRSRFVYATRTGSWLCTDPCRHGCVLIHVGAAQASIRKHHRIFALSVLLESMQQKTEAHRVLGVMHQAGMCVWLDQEVEGVSSAAHISCVPAAHPAACPSPS
jgi:hypothetical protein